MVPGEERQPSTSGMEPTRAHPGSPASDDFSAAATPDTTIDPEGSIHLPLDTDRCRGRSPTYVPSTGSARVVVIGALSFQWWLSAAG